MANPTPSNLYDVLESLIQAKYTRQRQHLLARANLNLDTLRFQMRLAKDLPCLKVNSYAFATEAVEEIGRLDQNALHPDLILDPVSVPCVVEANCH